MESNIHYVASGQFMVAADRQPLILKALLGTCVGVSVYDSVAGMGGLLHILLPEPVSGASDTHPGKYASTGVPAFLKALIEKGAHPDNMRATVAGGALVGPVSEQDMALDIGGRTAEKVHELLKRYNIPVSASETGGFFTCTLELDLNTGKNRICPSGLLRDPEEAFHYTAPSADAIAASVTGLKPIPQVALKILRMVTSEEADFKAIAAEVRKDQVITAQTLRMCNAALYSGRNQVASIDDALILLGQDTLIKSIISSALKTFYRQSDSVYSLCKGGLFHHAMGTAIVADQLAAHTGAAHRATAYTAGLLHDIGMVVLDQHITSACPLFYRGMKKENHRILEVEKRILGVDHCEVGAKLGLKWAFPENLIHAIRHHHRPEDGKAGDKLAYIVHAADLIMSRFQSGVFPESSRGSIADRLAVLGMGPSDFENFIDRLPMDVFSMQPETVLFKKT
ncbi:putative nucleotidyltransferase with HDIG domain [Desulfobotulus alkaliphilus]|uniref:Probable chemoreceptor glutamine deamidase CheD n=1 Tax=Desulfobotulus alkaliphilus TaxID=622671 RepID=A0A562RSZ1_9BACT|nr:HDOD domain-containing protein [Desulfobotulus alkaliphilus]TWI71664.1 putative nucleotidyltransferase with HDIG domain [Desulfobotulus alkaliphilus]